MRTLTGYLGRLNPGDFDQYIRLGASSANRRVTMKWHQETYAEVRQRYGFSATLGSPLLTAPADNMKLDKSSVPAYGITLQHYVQKLSDGLTINACPNAGDCTKACVLDNGNGRYDAVQRARRAKTEFLAYHPLSFAFLLGRELALAVRRDGGIFLRPNVNSDVEWETIAPALCNGETFGQSITLYGYTKMRKVLDTDGWLGRSYRVAYSLSEKDGPFDMVRVVDFLARGGSVAQVTNRKPKQPVAEVRGATRMDADLTDEWIFGSGVIGDLSAKGKARQLIGVSEFVNTRLY